MLVNICVCTYRRPVLLRDCLDSLLDMHLPETTSVRLTIVDNDEAGSSRSVVERHRIASVIDLTYQIERKRGIPCARNRALAIAKDMRADLLVFIDDDERVRPDWLIELLKASASYDNRAAVHGLVVPRLSEGLPDSLSGLFNPRNRPEGKSLTACATDNVLIPMSFVVEHGLVFDESRPLAGGTDTIFFTKAHELGLPIYQTNKAVVDETIPQSRSNLRWHIRRKFRAGLTDAWRRRQKGQSVPYLLVSSVYHIVLSAMLVLFFQMFLKNLDRNKSILGVSKYLGILMGTFGMSVNSYVVVDS